MSANNNKKANAAWIKYRWEAEFMLPERTFKDGYVAGHQEGVNDVMRVLKDHVGADIANEVSKLLEQYAET